jgi:hypothetical protein
MRENDLSKKSSLLFLYLRLRSARSKLRVPPANWNLQHLFTMSIGCDWLYRTLPCHQVAGPEVGARFSTLSEVNVYNARPAKVSAAVDVNNANRPESSASSRSRFYETVLAKKSWIKWEWNFWISNLLLLLVRTAGVSALPQILQNG